MGNRNDDIDDKDNDNDDKSRCAAMLHIIIVVSRGIHVVASLWSLSSAAAAAADDDDDAPDSVGIYHHHHCYCSDNNEATRVLRRCASRGEQQSTWAMALPHAINGRFHGCIVVVVVVAFLWLWLVVEVASSFPAVVSSFPVVASSLLWLVVAAALTFPMVALWLLRLHCCFLQLCCHFLQLPHGCCGRCVLRLRLVVAFASLPTVVSSFPAVVL